MADNTVLSPGSGGDTIRTELRGSVKTQIVALDLNPAGSETLMAGSMPVTGPLTDAALRATAVPVSGPLTDTALRATPVPVSGTVTATTGGLTDTQLRASAVPTSLAALPALVAGSAAIGTVGVTSAPYAVADNSAGLPPVAAVVAGYDGTNVQAVVTNAAGNLQVGLSAAIPAGSNTVGKVDQGTGGASAWKVDPSAVTSPVSAASLPLPTGAATAAKQPGVGTAGSPSADVLTVQGAVSMTPVAVSGTVTADTELPAAAALSDTATNPTAPGVGAFGLVYNGGTWHRQTGIAGAADTGLTNINGNAVDTSTGATSAGTQRVVIATDQPPYPVTTVANSIGSWSTATALAQTTTVKSIKSSAGVFGGYYVYNPNATVAYIQVFNAASGSVTLGTTAPKMVFGIPAGSAANIELSQGIVMSTAISLACTTLATGNTTPASGLDLTIFYL